MKKYSVKNLVLCGFGMAVVFILTVFVAIPIGQFGYVNLGDSGIMLFSSILNPALAFLVGGIGSAISDLYLGYTQYAIFTLIIKGLEALVIAFLFKKIDKKYRLFSFLVGMIIMIVGYYLADAILYGDFIVAFGGVGFNFMQGLVSCIVATIVFFVFYRSSSKYFKN